ncbi:hypothetical protein [Raoultella ornithinolytica]
MKALIVLLELIRWFF